MWKLTSQKEPPSPGGKTRLVTAGGGNVRSPPLKPPGSHVHSCAQRSAPAQTELCTNERSPLESAHCGPALSPQRCLKAAGSDVSRVKPIDCMVKPSARVSTKIVLKCVGRLVLMTFVVTFKTSRAGRTT
ncbi:unnamed protein product [Pleuronectes platessa]|uniref:Uncharacterized protein n=1 Tax=Pleuronectes platessa TaxID=8262 RepID=A0A9N7U2D5_PLEPL|nr:unnamed protein product [Pleuronectes platessa]